MKHVALYVRVSTEEQRDRGISIDNQIQELKDYCEKHGYNYKLYCDAGISGHATYKKRPALLQMVRACQRGEVSLILFVALDRFFRSVKDYYEVMGQIGNVPWKAIREDYETETSTGRFKVNIMLSVAQQEAEKDSERIKHVMAYKKSIGEWTGGRIPFGLRVENKRFAADPEKGPIVRQMFDTYLQTLSGHKAHKFMLSTPYPCGYDVVCDRLKNPCYIGFIISQEEHDRIIAQFRKRLKNAEQKRIYLFGGLMPCPVCGRALTIRPTIKKNAAGEYMWTTYAYRCRDKHEPQFNERHIEAQLLERIDSMIEEQRYEVQLSRAEDHTEDLILIEKKAERLKDLYIDGEIDRQTYNRRKAEFEAQIMALQPKEQISLPELPADWKIVYADLSREGKKLFWQSLIKKIDITDRQKLSVTFNSNI